MRQPSRRRWRAPAPPCARAWRAAPLLRHQPMPPREIVRAHLELLDDPELLAAAQALIAQGKGAGFAWRQSIRAHTALLASLADARLRERVADLMDLEDQVLSVLHPAQAAAAQPLPRAGDRAGPRPAALAADGARSRARGRACATSRGGATSHVAILAAAMNIPAVVALGPACSAIAGRRAGDPRRRRGGCVRARPTAARRGRRPARIERRSARVPARRRRPRRPRLPHGRRHAHRGVRQPRLGRRGAAPRCDNGAEGCGLLRTEFLFLDRDSAADARTSRRAPTRRSPTRWTAGR